MASRRYGDCGQCLAMGSTLQTSASMFNEKEVSVFNGCEIHAKLLSSGQFWILSFETRYIRLETLTRWIRNLMNRVRQVAKRQWSDINRISQWSFWNDHFKLENLRIHIANLVPAECIWFYLLWIMVQNLKHSRFMARPPFPAWKPKTTLIKQR